MHGILDNWNTHASKLDLLLQRRPLVHPHFTPTDSSWLIMLECWFIILGRAALHDASCASAPQLRAAKPRQATARCCPCAKSLGYHGRKSMQDNLRRFQVADPFGRTWDVEFRWLQNAISIRHADAVDCKYYLSDGEEKRELVIALPHPGLTALAADRGRELTDAWCMGLAALHLRRIIATWEDMEKPIVTLSARDLAEHNVDIEKAAAAVREHAETHK